MTHLKELNISLSLKDFLNGLPAMSKQLHPENSYDSCDSLTDDDDVIDDDNDDNYNITKNPYPVLN